MPKIELSKNPAIRLDFLAHCVWPKDASKRNAYITLTNEASLTYLAEFQKESPFKVLFVDGHYELYAKQSRDEFRSLVIDPEVTSATITEGYGLKSLEDEIFRLSPSMMLTGYVTYTLIAMLQHHNEDSCLRGGASITKAQEVVADIQNIALTTVENAWLKYKNVSHYLAAAFSLSVEDNSTTKYLLDHLSDPKGEFIPISQYFLLALTSFKPHGKSTPLIKMNEAWLLPDSLVTSEMLGLEVQPLPKRILENLQTRKAKTRKSG